MYFEYGEKEIEYLIKKDKVLGEAIKKIGHINREIDTDLFSSVVNIIIGQQISTSAQVTICARVKDSLKEVTPENICKTDDETLQKCGISFRKVSYIKAFSKSVLDKELILEELHHKDDEEVIKILSSIKGIGVWTAEMLMIFSLNRPNVISFGDLAIHRGLRMLYHHREITPKLFEKYKRRYSPYASVASLYIWAISGGAIEGMKDYAPKKKSPSKK